jgi:hypothetical protein
MEAHGIITRGLPCSYKRSSVKRILLSLLLIAVSCVFAQQKPKTASKPASPGPGIVSGRVFAITGGGDVKPARMAKVYLMYLYRIGTNLQEMELALGASKRPISCAVR